MSTSTPVPQYPRTVTNSRPANTSPAYVRQVEPPTAVPFNVTTPIRSSSSSSISQNAKSTSYQQNGASSYRHFKLDQVAERQMTPVTGNGVAPAAMSAKALGKRKRGPEEEEAVRRADTVLRSNRDRDISQLNSDYIPVGPFQSGMDIVERLLPFHIWQVHDEDLDCSKKDDKRRREDRAVAAKLVNRHAIISQRMRKLELRSFDSETRADRLLVRNLDFTHMRDTHAILQSRVREARSEQERLSYDAKRKEDDLRRASFGIGMGMYSSPSTIRNGTGMSLPGTPMYNRVPNGVGAFNVPHAGTPRPTSTIQPLNLSVATALLPDLRRLKILPHPDLPTGFVTPARLIRQSDDQKQLVLSLIPQLMNAEQLNFLATILKPGSPAGKFTPPPSSPLTPGPSNRGTPSRTASPQNLPGA